MNVGIQWESQRKRGTLIIAEALLSIFIHVGGTADIDRTLRL